MQVFTQPACLSPLCMAASSKSKTPQTSMVISGMAILKCSCIPEYMLHLLVPSRRMDYGFNCALKCMDSWPNRPSAFFMWMHWRNKAMFLLHGLFPCNGSSQKKKKKKSESKYAVMITRYLFLQMWKLEQAICSDLIWSRRQIVTDGTGCSSHRSLIQQTEYILGWWNVCEMLKSNPNSSWVE